MADWSDTSPDNATAYVDVLEKLRARDKDALTMMLGGAGTSLPTNAVRANATTKKLEKWNGTSWADLFDKWGINVDKLDGLDAGNQDGNIPINNGSLNSNLNAQKLNGKLDTAFAAAAHSHGAATTAVSGFMSAADKSKLNGIAAGAQVNPSANAILSSLLGVDGAGSGLDADLLDGWHRDDLRNASNLYTGSIPSGRYATNTINGAALIDGTVNWWELANAAVKQSKLSTGLQTASSASPNVTATAALSGASYCFFPGVYRSSSNTWEVFLGGHPTADYGVVKHTSGASYFAAFFGRLGSGGGNAILESRYVAASPPYDLGDGDIPLFLHLMLVDGEIVMTSASPDPVWMHNGPTRALYQYTENKKRLMGVRRIQTVTRAQVDKDQKLLDRWLEERVEPKYEIFEIDQKFKNADMNLIPHPFIGMEGAFPGKKVRHVVIDPPNTAKLLEIHNTAGDGESVNDLIHAGYITIDNAKLRRKCPKGVGAHKWKFKNTRQK